MFDMKGIVYRFAADPDLANRSLPVEVRRNLLLIFKESINNVVRHSTCTEAKVNIGLKGNALYLSVEDNGRGISGAKHGHGLANMRARAEAAHGGLTVTSGDRDGTRVSLHIPLE
jgi:signal transduction histidine kinase